MSGPVETARQHWGAALPDWVEALAKACHGSSQARVAARIDRSPAVISNVLRRKYPGDMAALEDLVRGALMAGTVNCPALGTLPSNECRGWMAKARSFGNTNALRVQMYRACRVCDRFRKADQGAPVEGGQVA
jgi:hypothetical protein